MDEWHSDMTLFEILKHVLPSSLAGCLCRLKAAEESVNVRLVIMTVHSQKHGGLHL